ncbi:MAG TPA: hypothetical protein EYG38_01950 [Verrucomicrobia bacterium]|nr:hypothetical protein [Verrucomicrobiota bacterium]
MLRRAKHLKIGVHPGIIGLSDAVWGDFSGIKKGDFTKITGNISGLKCDEFPKGLSGDASNFAGFLSECYGEFPKDVVAYLTGYTGDVSLVTGKEYVSDFLKNHPATTNGIFPPNPLER